MVAVQIKYRGEMPKRGFFHRLGEGRRTVFMVLMFMSLFGGAFGFSRNAPWLVPIIFGLFFGGVAYSFVSWKREDAERLLKEIDKVQENLNNEIKRQIGDLQKEKLGRISAHIEKLKKEALRRMEEVGKETSVEKTTRLDQERKELRNRLRSLEQKAKEIQDIGRQIPKLQQTCNEVESGCKKLLQDLSKEG